MNPILAQVKKDVRSLRLFLLLFMGLVALCLLDTLIHFLKFMGIITFITINGSPLPLFLGLLMIMTGVLVVQFIYEDPLTESTAFWRTRPISRLQLFGAKFLLITPPLVILGLILHVMLPGVEICRYVGIFMLGLAAFAAVTSSILQLASMYGAISIGCLLLDKLASYCFQAVFSSSRFHPEILAHWGEYGWALPCLAFLSIIIHQYLTLRTKVSCFLLLLTFVMMSQYSVDMSFFLNEEISF